MQKGGRAPKTKADTLVICVCAGKRIIGRDRVPATAGADEIEGWIGEGYDLIIGQCAVEKKVVGAYV